MGGADPVDRDDRDVHDGRDERDVIEAERAELNAEIDGRTLVDVFMATCDANGGRPALMIKDGDAFVTYSWSDYRGLAAQVAAGLVSKGIERGGSIALMMTNRPEHVIADVAGLLSGATPVSIYNTLTTEQVRHIADNSQAAVAIVENAELAERWLSVAESVTSITTIVVIDGADAIDDPRVIDWEDLVDLGRQALSRDPHHLESRWREVQPDDPATVIYTSGTTGPPKGVVLTHHNVLFQLGVIARFLDIPPGSRGISYLPLAHVAERMTTHYLGIRHGGTVSFVKDVTEVLPTMQAARPQLFMAVPRVWEKMHAAILARIEEDPRKAPIARRALAVGIEVAEAERRGEKASMAARAQRALFDRLVFSKIRHGIGLDELHYAVSGAAPISDQLLTFFAAIGIEVIEVYGMTETTALITANRPGEAKIGTVGRRLPGLEIRLATDGEISVRGPVVTPGYFRQPDATAEAIDEDGWLNTGDLGAFDDDGYLKIVGRTKELIITAGGKNLSPNLIEQAIKSQSSIIGQICAVGDGKPFIAALIVLDGDLLKSWAAVNGVNFTSVAQMCQDPDVVAEVRHAVDEGNQQLSRVEQVKQWTILPEEWTAESEELTPSMKLRRSVVYERHAEGIDELYAAK
ncbi:MAG: long-chain fatty acid--CoA ligase [Nitriliruptoraceae bacterium]